MNIFTDFIKENRKNYTSDALLASEISTYLNKVNKILPQNVKDVIYLTSKYNLVDKQDIEYIKNSSKNDINNLSIKYNMPISEIDHLRNLLKDIKNQLRLLPQYQSPTEREAIKLGKLSMDDLTIDLKTPQGRNAATKIYMPLIYKIVNQYVGKSSLSRQELISAGLVGFTSAMNEWNNDRGDKKSTPFKTYAGFRVKQQILNDINELSYNLSGTNYYNVEKYGATLLNAVSYDAMDNGEFDIDKFSPLGTIDDNLEPKKNEEKNWQELYNIINNEFKQRDVDIFYRYFGLNGYKREKSKDIAKSMNMSEGNIKNSIINKMILFLKRNKKASDILSDIRDAYNESLMVDLAGLDKQEIMEALSNDDMFILLEELNRWNDFYIFKNMLFDNLEKLSIQDKKSISILLKGDFNTLDMNFKKYKKLIIDFLSNMYPSENMNKKTDVSLLEYMEELQNYIVKYKIKL